MKEHVHDEQQQAQKGTSISPKNSNSNKQNKEYQQMRKGATTSANKSKLTSFKRTNNAKKNNNVKNNNSKHKEEQEHNVRLKLKFKPFLFLRVFF
jgi:hypothetical protein